MSSAPGSNEIWHDARWLAQALDPRAGLLRAVELTPEDYRQASFLDDRLLQGGHPNHLLNWAEIERGQPDSARSDARWIFHIGHVGSTLVSRLLGELGGVLAIREPRALRDLTFFPSEVRNMFVPTARALMSRTFTKDGAAVVKATSMVSEIAAELVGEKGCALFLHASADTYVRTILAGDSSPAELQTLSHFYRARAARAGIEFCDPLTSPAKVAALVWACEMTALESAADKLPGDAVTWADFDEFLEEPAAQLGAFCQFFKLRNEPGEVARIVQGPLMNRYSKALEYEFGPETRRRQLADAGETHSEEIASALAMLSQAAEKAPLLARALLR
jgi:hypothetical protein